MIPKMVFYPIVGNRNPKIRTVAIDENTRMKSQCPDSNRVVADLQSAA